MLADSTKPKTPVRDKEYHDSDYELSLLNWALRFGHWAHSNKKGNFAHHAVLLYKMIPMSAIYSNLKNAIIENTTVELNTVANKTDSRCRKLLK